MGKSVAAPLLILFLNLSYLILPTLACPTCPKPKPPPPPPKPKPTPTPCPPPPAVPVPTPTVPTPTVPVPTVPVPAAKSCPIDALKLDACVDVLGGLVHAVVGRSATDVCCPVLGGLVDLDAALCLCTTIRAKILNISIVLPIALQLLIDCGKRVPSDYQCPA